ncbi:hypothetical protein HD597_012919 [Nonomuraea thailandensis]|uniref:Uncharacterized protein n=1 Tax=Nonomuraea thailandensis TaxID=1188745 RepID=A0A9X2KAH0_9ACTN|nr:hypothetical protein [Nonomuraea thailandensis]MCP2365815.1 hypothetical protein [Nonomuraea thailandensis]
MITYEIIETFLAAGAGALAGHLALTLGRRVMHWGKTAIVGLAEATIARFSPAVPGEEHDRL